MSLKRQFWLSMAVVAFCTIAFTVAFWHQQNHWQKSVTEASKSAIEQGFYAGVANQISAIDRLYPAIQAFGAELETAQYLGNAVSGPTDLARFRSMLRVAGVDFALHFDAHGTVVTQYSNRYSGFDSGKDRDMLGQVQSDLFYRVKHFADPYAATSDEAKTLSQTHIKSGVFFSEIGSYYVVAYPVVSRKPNGEQRLAGYWILGSDLDALLSGIGDNMQLGVSTSVNAWPGEPSSSTVEVNSDGVSGGGSVIISRLDTLSGNPVWIKLSPRAGSSKTPVLAVSKTTPWALLMMVLVFSISYRLYRMFWCQSVNVIDRLDRIQTDQDYTERLTAVGKSVEINHLSCSINSLLSTVQFSREEANKITSNALHKTRSHIDSVVHQASSGDGERQASIANTRLDQLSLVHRLSSAIEQEQLDVLFQPQYATIQLSTVPQSVGDDGRLNTPPPQAIVDSVDALARWHDQDLGEIPPAQFIPLAKAAGLSMPLGNLLMRTACSHAKRWQSEGFRPLITSLKLASAQFYHPSLKNSVLNALHTSRLPARYLELSIKESVLLQNPAAAEKILNDLATTSVLLSIEDFGGARSSLSSLVRWPVRKIKLHASLVSDIATSKRSADLLEGVIGLCQSLDLSVVAVGVETQAQLAVLKAHGCDSVQGFCLSSPVSAEEIFSLLSPISPMASIDFPRLAVSH